MTVPVRVLIAVLILVLAVPALASDRSSRSTGSRPPPELRDEDEEESADAEAEEPAPRRPAKRPAKKPRAPAPKPVTPETLLDLELETDRPAQGTVTTVKVHLPPGGTGVRGTFCGRDLAWIAGDRVITGLIPVDLEQEPGRYPLTITAINQANQPITDTVPLTVVKGNFKVQRLKVPPKMVDPDPAALARIEREEAETKKAFSTVVERQLKGRFLRPVPGAETAAFGGRRIFNGKPKSPHSGADLRGAVGTPIQCPADGTVVLVGDHYFTGKTVILAHGLKLYTQYAHLSEIAVKKGQEVAAGAPLGKVGQTGRVTGPHLHWGMRLSGAKVNPLDLTRLPDGPAGEDADDE